MSPILSETLLPFIPLLLLHATLPFLPAFYKRLLLLPSFVVGLLAASLPTWRSLVLNAPLPPGHAHWLKVTSKAVTTLGSPLATSCNSHFHVPKTSAMITTQIPFTLPSLFTYSAPLEVKVASPLKLLKPNKRMQEPPKSPSSLVFYSLSSSGPPTDLITFTHGRADSFLNCVSHFSLAMRHNLLKPSPFPSWIWNTPFTCLSPLSLVSSPGLFKFLSTASLIPLDGPVLILSSRISAVPLKKLSISPHSPPSSTSFRTFSLPRSRHSSNITYLMINSVTTLHALITSNPTIFFLEPRLNPWVTPMIGISLGQSPSTPLASKKPLNSSPTHTQDSITFSEP